MSTLEMLPFPQLENIEIVILKLETCGIFKTILLKLRNCKAVTSYSKELEMVMKSYIREKITEQPSYLIYYDSKRKIATFVCECTNRFLDSIVFDFLINMNYA